MDDWVAARLGLLFADKRGRIVMGVRMRDCAARVALFLDLALRDRLLPDEDGGGMDTTRTGFPAADAFLGWIDTHPDGTVFEAFRSAPVGMRDVLEGGSRSRLRRGLAVDPAASAQQRALVRSLAAGADLLDPADATLVALADALELVQAADIHAVLAQCGPAVDVIADCRNYLMSVKDGLAGISGLLNNASAGS